MEAMKNKANQYTVPYGKTDSLTVCIVFTDVTRSSPDQLLVSGLLRELEAAGLRRDLKALQLELGLTQYNRVFEPPVMS